MTHAMTNLVPAVAGGRATPYRDIWPLRRPLPSELCSMNLNFGASNYMRPPPLHDGMLGVLRLDP